MVTTVAMYSHDSVGLGHARRNRALAFALNEHLPARTGDDVRGLLIAGSVDAVQASLPEGWDWLALPGITHRAGGYGARNLALDPHHMRSVRGEITTAALEALEPDLLIIDRHPFGADRELLPTLRRLHRSGTRVVLGLREVLDSPENVQPEWDALGGADAVARLVDEIWVYGDPAVYDMRETGELPPALAEIATHTGYLATGRPAHDAGHGGGHSATGVWPPFVLTVLGGGSDGAEVATASVQAQPPAGHEHLVITGPQMPKQDVAALQEIAAPGTRILRSAPDVPELIDRASAVVSMCGYNTACEVMATDTPALMVPRVKRRQEQLRRAEALARAGVAEMLLPQALAPRAVTEFFARSVRAGIDRSRIARDGLTAVAQRADELLARPATHAALPIAGSPSPVGRPLPALVTAPGGAL